MSTDPTPGTLLVGRYRLRESLGRGAHGVVFLADDLARGGAQVALKWIGGLVGGEPESSAEQILRWFRHPGWAEILDVGRCGEHDWFQALQYVAGKDLSHVDEPLPEDEVWGFLTQMARVLRALHARGLIHYDITPGNVLCELRKGERHYVLTDGGLAHVGPVRGVARGTPAYMAPEVTEDAGHDHRVDLYSLGLLAFRLATGRDAFEGKASQVLVRRRRERAPDIQQFVPTHSDALARVIGRLLETRPNNRPADAEALLHEIRLAHDTALPDLTAAEALAAAGGGPLVGRAERMDRFERTLEDVSRLLPARPGGPVQGPCTALADPVVLLRGPTGAGSTRMLEEFVARARSVDMPVVLMAAPEAPVDGLRRLEELAAALHALGRDTEDLEATTPAPRGRRDVEPSIEHARWMERLVPLAEEAARRTPFLIAIEAYAAWPTELRSVLDVLVRHVASRHVHGGKGARPPILVAVDVGSGSPDALRVPDASNPEAHEWTLGPLNPGQLADLLVSKFPQLRIDPDDAKAVHEHAGGLPGGAAHLMGVAAARGDFQFEAGWLVWQLDDLANYDAGDGLPAHLHHAVAAESAAGRQWLRFMAILRAPLSEATFRRLGDVAVATTEPGQDLLTRFRSGNRHYVRLAHPTLATRLLENAPTEREIEALLAFLDREAHRAPLVPTLRIACARLLAARDRKVEALQTLLGIERDASPELRVEAVQTAIDFLPPMPEALETIERLATLLPQSNAGAAVGAQLLDITGPDQFAPVAYVHLNGVFSVSSQPQLAYELGEPKSIDQKVNGVLLALAHRARSCLEQGNRRQARASLSAARTARLRASEAIDDNTRATILRTHSALLLADNRPASARRALRSAASLKANLAPELRARVLLALGVACAQMRLLSEADDHLVRSLRLSRALGDTRNMTAAAYNLARCRLVRGQLRQASLAARDCAAVASRHGMHRALSRSLAMLATCLEADGRCPQAASVLRRAVYSGRGNLPGSRLAPVEARSVVLAVCTADGDSAKKIADDLLASARRSGARSRERLAGHWALFECSVLAGHVQRAQHHGRRLSELEREHTHESGLPTALLVRALQHAGAGSCERHAAISELATHRHTAEARDLLRVALFFERGEQSEERLHRTLSRMRSGFGRRHFVASFLRPPAAPTSSTRSILKRVCEHAGEALLLARLSAVAALRTLPEDRSLGSRLASHAVAGITSTYQTLPALRRRLLPPEFVKLARALAPDAAAQFSNADTLTELNAIAHAALVASPQTSSDDRRTQALRNALELGARLRADEPLDRLLEDLTHHAAALTGAERACVVHVDENGELVLEVSSDSKDIQDGPQFSHSVINRVLRYRRPLLWTDVFEDEELFGKQSVEAMRLNSVMCVPMLLGDELYGVLYADNTARAAAFDDTDLDVLCLFAQLAANALHSQTMISRLRRSKEEIAELQGRMIAGERLRVIGELSSGVAHEFNNLLTSILARVQLINLEAQSASLRPDLNMIEKACLDAAEVVRRLQSFGKTQQQKDFERLDLGDIARDAVEFLRPLWADKTGTRRRQVGVSVVCPAPVTIVGNPTELREIVTNLVKNALEAIPEKGDIRVEIAETGGNIMLAVRDNGQGMSPEIQRRAFDPFFTTKGERGTGLGLCLVRQIVERHGGQMEIHSVTGTGTTVQMRFPSEASDPSYAVLPPSEGEPADVRLRVLVVDDDDDVRMPLCRYLEKQGYEVYSASSGSEGLEIAQAEQPDVVISDVRMPGMDGLQLCEALHQSLPKAPVVLMSGWASGVDPARAQAVGASTLLAKPFAMQQVAEILAEYGNSGSLN